MNDFVRFLEIGNKQALIHGSTVHTDPFGNSSELQE